MQETEPQTIVQTYLKALDAGDLSRCVDLFADDATIEFQSGIFQGKEAIEEWHKARFAVDFQVLSIDGIRTQGDLVIVDAVATSKRLKAWKIKKISGRATLLLQQGKIRNAKFGIRMTNLFEGWS